MSKHGGNFDLFLDGDDHDDHGDGHDDDDDDDDDDGHYGHDVMLMVDVNGRL